MHKIIFDLYVTFIAPLAVLTTISLTGFIQKLRETRQKFDAKEYAIFGLGCIAILLGFFFANDTVKVYIGLNFYELMRIASPVIFLFAALYVLDYSRRDMINSEKFLRIVIFIFVMFAAAGSTVHFMHQVDNARHALCPHCNSDEDEN